MNFAAIEIGSNAVLMIVVELIDSCELRILERWSAHLRLGDSVFEHRVIPEKIFSTTGADNSGFATQITKIFSSQSISHCNKRNERC